VTAAAPAGPADGDDDGPARQVTEARGDVLANAAAPRRAADTNQNLREAQRVLGHGGVVFGENASVAQDVVAGDKIVYQYAGAAVTTYLVDGELVDLATHAYVGRGALVVPADRSLVILQGPPGHGKAATALRLLVTRGHRRIRGFRRDVAVADLAPQLGSGTGYVIEDLPAAAARALTALTAHDLDAKLRATGSHLVVTCGNDVTFVDSGLHRFVVAMPAPPAHRAVLAAHLRHRLGAAGRDAVLGRTDVMALFAREVAADGPLHRAAEFARHAADLHRLGRLDTDLLRSRLHRLVTAEVAGWFAGLGTTATRCLAISLALLDGLPYDLVVTLGERLARRLAPPGGAAAVPSDPFGESLTQRLARLRATVSVEDVPTRLGAQRTEIARYLDPAYPAAVLGLVWREHADVRDDLLAWLRDLGDHPADAVRVRAATAVGLMSLSDFPDIHEAVVARWARAASPRRREMAAYALRQPGSSPALRDRVLGIVDGWRRAERWQLQATAARVFGGALGAADVPRALDALDRMAVTRNADVALAVADSVAELVDADPGGARPVLDRVHAWLGNGAGPRTAVGELSFLTIATDLVGPGEPGGPDVPLLLTLASADRGMRQLVAYGWEQVLNGRLFHRDARAAAGRWAAMVERHPAARDAAALVFAMAAAGSTRTRAIVAALARDWSAPGGVHAPLTAGAVVAALP